MHSRACAPSHTHWFTHMHVPILVPFLLASDTMVTEQPASPCVPWPSRVSESKITAGTPLGTRGSTGWIEVGGESCRGRSVGRLGRRWGELKEEKGWEEREKKHLTFMLSANRKCHFSLAALFHPCWSLQSHPPDLSFAQQTQLHTCCHTSPATSLCLNLLTRLCINPLLPFPFS